MLLVLALAGCDGGSDSAASRDPESDVDTDTDSDTDADADVGCTKMVEGVWSMDGTCYGMQMSATLTLYPKDSCTFAFSDWSMAMESPGGGSVSGTTLHLSGLDDWDTCEGKTDGKTAAGSCPGRAYCVFEMSL
jgi:hypothetical protein